MRILIDINHPAHVHFFRNFAIKMMNDGHKILFTTRDKEVAIDLLKSYNLPFKSFGKHKKGFYGKILGMLEFNFKLFLAALKFKPAIFLNLGSIYAPQVSFILRKPSVVFDDTEHAKMEQSLYKPFATTIVTPFCYTKILSTKQIYYKGCHEKAYLDSKYYKPNPSIYNLLGIDSGEPYAILRFVSWDASHDVGYGGLDYASKKNIVNELSKQLKVYISSEGTLPSEFSPYQIIIPPERMHDALAYATLFLGEGGTMASECAVLGTPAIYVNSLPLMGYLKEEQEHGLLFHFSDSNGVLDKALELLSMSNLKEEWQKRRQKMLAEKIDVTAFMVWLIENYPKSVDKLQSYDSYRTHGLTPELASQLF